MASGFLILHGIENHRPPGHWQFLLAARLVELGLACLLWFRAAPELGDDERIERLLLVSPPSSDRVPTAGASFRLGEFDAHAVSTSVRGEIAIFCSDADPYNPSGAQALYGDALGVTPVVFSGAGHITPESGYGPWSAAEDWCAGGLRLAG